LLDEVLQVWAIWFTSSRVGARTRARDVARIGTPAVGHHLFDHRQAESGRLAGAGLGKTDQVMAFHDERDCFGLDRRRRFETQGGEGRKHMLGEAKVFESGQCNTFSGAQNEICRNCTMRFRFRFASRTPRDLGTCGLIMLSALHPAAFGRTFCVALILRYGSLRSRRARSRGGRKVTLGLMSLFCRQKSRDSFLQVRRDRGITA
jgi:hypothetical protein